MPLLAVALACCTLSAHGVSVHYSPGWYATAAELTYVSWPVQVLAVGSYRFSHDRGHADGCEPKEALDQLPPDGAFIFGWEYAQPLQFNDVQKRDFPPRPKHFALGHQTNTECFGKSYTLLFRDACRFFQIHVAFGKQATDSTRAAALHVIDSFHASPS